ncbi:MAG: acyltransferase [Caulobacteraceae bacterium]|nr:acyltransferase [Caulobacteraceae bacterium]
MSVERPSALSSRARLDEGVGLRGRAPRPQALDAPRAAPAAPRREGYRPDIDGLRAVAVLVVVLYHAGVAAASGGFVGVDIFFVISGYVISKSLLGDIEAGRFSVTGFYERRIKRIFPALFVTMAVTFVAAVALLLPTYLLDYCKSLIATAAFVSNLYFWKNSGYFANGADLRPLLHTWSLSVEEQFYIFAPLTLFVVFRFFRKRWALALTPLALASLGLSVFASKVGPTANFFLLPTRAWELLLGALVALTALPSVRARWLRELLAALGASGVAFAVFAYTPATPFPGIAALPPCLGAALLIHVGSCGGSWPTRLLALPPMVAIGLVSYSLYLVHWPIISFLTYYQLRAPGPAEAPLVVGASLALAYASWRFVEQPFRSRSFRPSRAVVIGGGLLAMALAAALGAAGLAAKGFPGRFPGFAESAARQAGGPEGLCFLDNDPDPTRWSAAGCTLTHGGTEKALLWGDSYANHYATGIEAYAAQIPYSVMEYAAAGCPPVLSYSAYNRPGCQRFNQHAIAIIREQGIRTVVMSARWADLERRGLGGLADTLAVLSKLGVNVYVIGQSPMFTADVHVISFREGERGRDVWPISFDPSLNRRLAAIAGPARFVDPLPGLCQGTICPYRERGEFLFADEGHFSPAGSLRAVASYFPLLRRSAPPAPARQAADSAMRR